MDEMTRCAFFGHSQIYQDEEVRKRLDATIKALIEESGVCEFLVGEQGDFDRMAAAAVRRAKSYAPNIELNLVIPYRTKALQEYKEYYQKDYDTIIYPEAVWGCHYKAAITKRNRWLADEAGYIIAYVARDFGGAATALRYAQKLKRNIINSAPCLSGMRSFCLFIICFC